MEDVDNLIARKHGFLSVKSCNGKQCKDKPYGWRRGLFDMFCINTFLLPADGAAVLTDVGTAIEHAGFWVYHDSLITAIG